MTFGKVLEILFELLIPLYAWFKVHGGHGQVRVDVVIVDVGTGADIDRVEGPIVTL